MKKSLCVAITVLVIGLAWSPSVSYGKSSVVKKNKTSAAAVKPAAFSAPKSVSAAGITFTWRTNGQVLLGTLSAPSGGWIAVGFGGDTMATVGKVVIGSVTNNVAKIEIQAIDGRKHARTSGTIIQAYGKEEDKQTRITFKATLADLGLEGKVGTSFPIALARNSGSKDMSVYHNGTRDSVMIVL
jgi:hypothetical protein